MKCQEPKKVILKRIKASRRCMAELKDSVGRVSLVVEQFQELEVFLDQTEKEVAQKDQKEKKLKRLLSTLALLYPVFRFLTECWEQAKKLFEQTT
jgi:hypothetical protein